MGQLGRAGHHVADRPHVLLVRLLVLVGHDEAPLVEPHRRAFGHQTLGARPPADRHHDRWRRRPRARRPGARRCRSRRASGACPCTCDPGEHLDAPLAEGAGDHRGDVGVATGQDGVERLEHGDLRARGRRAGRRTRSRSPRRRPPPPTAGSWSRSRNSSEVSTSRPSTSSPGSVRGTEPAASTTWRPTTSVPASSPSTDPDPAAGQQGAGPRQHGDLAALQQSRQAPEELVDHRVLAGLADGEVDGRRAGTGADPELAGPGHRPVDGGRLEELLGRHAAAVQAGPADLVPLDDGDVEPGGGAVEGGGVATGAAADDDDVELRLTRRRHRASCRRSALPRRTVLVPCRQAPARQRRPGNRGQPIGTSGPVSLMIGAWRRGRMPPSWHGAGVRAAPTRADGPCPEPLHGPADPAGGPLGPHPGQGRQRRRPPHGSEAVGGRGERRVLVVGQLQVGRGGVGFGLLDRGGAGDHHHVGPPEQPGQRHLANRWRRGRRPPGAARRAPGRAGGRSRAGTAGVRRPQSRRAGGRGRSAPTGAPG